MRNLIRQQARTYFQRRTRAGIPWWIYGVALAVANAIRQLVVWQLDATSATRVVSFVVMVVGVIAVINGAATLARRRSTRRCPV